MRRVNSSMLVPVLFIITVTVFSAACRTEDGRPALHRLAEGNTKLILFVHGLGGDAIETWRGDQRGFLELIEADPELRCQYDVAFFDYPTSGFALPFFTAAPRIADLAAGLKTEIDLRFAGYDSVVLVGHSMGGLVARKYLLDELAAKRPLRVERLILYAVPNNGAELASLVQLVPFKSKQMKELARNSGFITELNNNWARLSPEGSVRIRYVVGAIDKIVKLDSAIAAWGNDYVDVVVNRGHRNLVKPENADDLAFVALKNFVNQNRTGTALVLTHGQKDWTGLRESVKIIDRGVSILEGNFWGHAEAIGRVQVLILPLPRRAEFQFTEINFLKKWVESGGSLLLLGYYAADRHHENNVSEVASAFGYQFADNLLMPPGSVYRDTRVQGASHNAQYAVKLSLDSDHEITEGVAKLAVLSSAGIVSAGAGAPDFQLETDDSSITWVPEYVLTPLGFDSNIETYKEGGAESVPVVVAFEDGGRVVISGTWKIFTVDYEDNKRFVRNILQWLKGKD